MSRASVTAELGLDTSSFQKGMKQTRTATEAWRKEMQRTGEIKLQNNSDWKKQMSGSGLPVPGPIVAQMARARAEAMRKVFGAPIDVEVTGLRFKKMKPPEMDRTIGQTQQWRHLMHSASDATKGLSAQQRRLAESAHGGGRAILELSRALEDSQYGMAGVINNIPGLVEALGGSSGLAGAISVAAVSFYTLYKAIDWYQKVSGDEYTSEQLETKARNLARAHQESVRFIKESAEAYIENNKARADFEAEEERLIARKLDRANILAEAEEEVAKARNSHLEGVKKAAADTAVAAAAEEAALNRKIDSLTKLKNLEEEQISRSEGKISLMEAERSTLKKMTETEKDETGKRHTRIVYQPKDRARGLILDAQIKEESERLRALQDRRKGATEGIEDALLQKKVAQLKAEADAIELKNRAEKEQQEEQKRRFDEWGEQMGQANQAVREHIAALREETARRKALDDARQTGGEDADIAHARARGRHSQADRLERAATRRRRIKELTEGPEQLSPQEAEARAREEERDKQGRFGKSLDPDRLPRVHAASGLDLDPRARGFRPNTPALDDAKRATRKAAEKVPGKEESVASWFQKLIGAVADIPNKLDELKQSLARPVGDSIAPANR